MIMSIFLQNLIKIKIILFLVVSFSVAQETNNTGNLSILLNGPGFIYINSELISDQSILHMPLKSGEYNISVSSSTSRKWNDRGYEKQIYIYPNQNIELNIKNTNLYYVNSYPFGSNVVFNNKVIATTPAYIDISDLDLTENLEIKKEGFYKKNFAINKSKNEYFLKLKPLANNNDLIVASSGLDNAQASWYKEGFVLVSVLSSWAAFYFKREADKNYSRYLSEGNSSKMNKYFDNTKRFDTYSDISLSVSITSIGTFMYFLIFD